MDGHNHAALPHFCASHVGPVCSTWYRTPTSGLCCLSCECGAGSAGGACGPCPTGSGAAGGLAAAPEPPCSEAGLWQGGRQLGTRGDGQHSSHNHRHSWLAQVPGGSAGTPLTGWPP